MYLDYTDEQRSLRDELRRYFADLMTDEVREALIGAHETSPVRREIFRQLGRDGMLGIGWPQAYGGQGRSAIDQFIFFDEAQRSGCPMPFVTLNTVGPTLMAHGSEEHKAAYLPGILTGDIEFAIGYSEPGAGTDLASLTTRAVRDGDQWVINGQKIFTSGANEADYIWLACRTNPDAPKHKGISIIIVPTDSPGFSFTPIVTVGNSTTTATYYDEVRVPAANLVGAENEGWKLITSQLNHERVGLAAVGALSFQLYEEVLAWAGDTPAAGESKATVLDQGWVQMDLARCHAKLEAMKLLNWQMAAAVAADSLPPARASAVKVYGTEAVSDIYHLLLGVLGAGAHFREGSSGALLAGRVEAAARTAQINTFGGGVNEVQREIVAWTGLKMTRGGRR
ncbi:MAG: acyl-CoA dehydrogenase [Acidimicrobiia bacterium]|nr:acyl-CoA dehydrogenase [Acidimicrobiia bacterium]MYE72446.1 acyl-CoA dehydrogenase [Acidimicrobiia bacterium]MYJ60721.1 acyl-CoA dehydrogenase [Acidimicrobiia bacterium]